tara:strand:+ start:574 stop:1020 length:447 start_codon:yes stop_codon:yes gene_type:complete
LLARRAEGTQDCYRAEYGRIDQQLQAALRGKVPTACSVAIAVAAATTSASTNGAVRAYQTIDHGLVVVDGVIIYHHEIHFQSRTFRNNQILRWGVTSSIPLLPGGKAAAYAVRYSRWRLCGGDVKVRRHSSLRGSQKESDGEHLPKTV